MKIATKTGDNGTTGLLFGERLYKTNDLFMCLGDLDETSAMIGLAKVKIKNSKKSSFAGFVEELEKIQKMIITIMGELNCTTREQVQSYINKFDPLKESDLIELDQQVEFMESLPELRQTDWVLYGKSETGAILDIASKICRRAERSLWTLKEKNTFHRTVLTKYINRLSDYLYLMARLMDLQTA